MRVLLAFEKKEVSDTLQFILNSRFNVETTTVKTAKRAIEIVNTVEIDLVIADFPGVGTILFKSMASMDRTKKAVLCVPVLFGKKREAKLQNLTGLNIAGTLFLTSLSDDLSVLMNRLLLELSDDLEALDKPSDYVDPKGVEYCRISTPLLTRLGPLKAPVYIKLSKVKYVKLFDQGDVFDEKDYYRYLLEKKVEYFYLRKTEIDEFIVKLNLELLNLLTDEAKSPNELFDLSVAVHETVQDLMDHMGPTEGVQELVKNHMKATLRNAASNPKLSTLLSHMSKDPQKYLASHSVILAQVACTLAVLMKWNSDTTFSKLNLAAFLHDFPIKDQSLAAVQSLDDLNHQKEHFTEAQIKTFLGHPVEGSNAVRLFHEVPPDVDTIILQHHEKPDGTGFPKGLTHSYISPLSCIFIVAHDVVHTAMANDGVFDLKKFLHDREPYYTGGFFKKILKSMVALKF